MKENKTFKEHSEDNIKSCFLPDFDFKKALICLIMNDQLHLDKLRVYIEKCQNEEVKALEMIKSLEKEEEIIGVLGKLESAKLEV